MPLKWRNDIQTHPALRPRISFRHVTNRTNRPTLIAALIPSHRINVETAPWLLWLEPQPQRPQEAFVIGLMSSIVMERWVRRFMEGHVEQEAFDCLRVPAVPVFTSGLAGRVVPIAGRLATPDDRFAEWAEAAGVTHGKLPEDEKQDMIAELDALDARLYGLDERQLVHVFETFHKGWDYETRLRAVLKHFRAHARTAAA